MPKALSQKEGMEGRQLAVRAWEGCELLDGRLEPVSGAVVGVISRGRFQTVSQMQCPQNSRSHERFVSSRVTMSSTASLTLSILIPAWGCEWETFRCLLQ